MVIYLGGGKEGLKRIEDTKNIFTVVQGRKVSTWTGDWIGRKIKINGSKDLLKAI